MNGLLPVTGQQGASGTPGNKRVSGGSASYIWSALDGKTENAYELAK